ncbi:MAG: hypothetical protein ACRDMY_03905 [Gaiellaceae bacterium]
MPSWFTIYKMPGPTPDRTSYRTRDEAAAGIRELFEHGLAERGEFYIVERDEQGNVLSVFDVDDEVAPPYEAATRS